MEKQADTNRERPTLAQLKEQGASKEEISKRKLEQRAERTAVRQAKRAEKSEAKKARKANVQRAAKWKGERKEIDKLKKAANKPRMVEKKRKQTEKWASRLQAQDEDIRRRGALAAARAESQAKNKAEEDSVIKELLREKLRKLKEETDDFIPLEDVDFTMALAKKMGIDLDENDSGSDFDSNDLSGSSSSDSDEGNDQDESSESSVEAPEPLEEKSNRPSKNKDKNAEVVPDEATQPKETATKKDKKRKRDSEPAAVPTLDEEPVSGTDNAEKPSKKSKKDKTRKQTSEPFPVPVKEETEEPALEVHTAEKSSKKKAKKEKRQKKESEPVPAPAPADAEVDEEVEIAAEKSSKKCKKDKKRKEELKPVAAPGNEAEVVESVPEAGTAEKSSKKPKKDKKRKRDSEIAEDPIPENEPSPTNKSNKEKKEKKAKTDAEAPESSVTSIAEDKAVVTAAEAEQWNVQELEGGVNRQAKFLRLLGGKKGAVPAASSTKGGASIPSARPHLDINKASKELEQQFEAGRRMKFDMGGQRKGLGA